MNSFLKKFNTVYLVYFLLLFTFPGSGNQNFYTNLICFLIILVFILTVNFSFLLFTNGYLVNKDASVYVAPIKIKIFTWIAFLGLLFYMFDRIFLLGIDYTAGLAASRYQLLDITEDSDTKGFKSVFSLLGNILIPFSFWNIIFLLKNEYNSINKNFYTIVNSIVVVISSLLFGGRTNILLYLLLIFILKQKKIKKLSSKEIFVRFIGVFFLFFIIGYVFFDRAEANEGIAVEYLNRMLSFLRGNLNHDFYVYLQHLEFFWSTLISVFLMIDAYFVHSFWVFTDILHQDNYGIIFGQNYMAILNKFNIVEVPRDPSTAGVFIGLPGAIYYDYGYLGLFFLFIITIGLGKLINVCYRLKNIAFNLGFIILISLQAIYLASPFIIISDIYMFPAFLFTGVIYSFFINKKYADRSN